MNGELYLAIHAAEFPAQALLRLRPELRSQPVAVLDGPALQQTVCALNRKARSCGAAHGMTRLEAEAVAGLQLIPRSLAEEAQARAILLECAAQFSPRIEETSRGTACSFVLDGTGSERLFGPVDAMAEKVRRAAANAGFRISVAASANFHAARLKAAFSPGMTILPRGEESRALEKLQLSALNLGAEQAETFSMWGIRTLGQLAALPEDSLVARFGPEASLWRALAAGAAAHSFQPIEPVVALREFCEFDSPIEEIDSLLFIAARMIDALVARVAQRALAVASLAIEMNLEGNQRHHLSLRPAVPTIDRKFLLKLLHLEAAAHPPQAAVLSLAIEADAGPTSKVQLGLFAPQTPEPSSLDVTLARLRAIVGDDRVGAPELEDTHRPQSFQLRALHTADSKGTTAKQEVRIALRRVRPLRTVHMALNGARPAAFHDEGKRYSVASAYGPWRSSGCWWSQDAWDSEEWDVLTTDVSGATLGCLLVRDRLHNAWRLEAYFD
jgi:protein ImuB